jgi:hypothetical protein
MQKDEAHVGKANECLRTHAGSSRTGEKQYDPCDRFRRTSCMTLARSVGGSIATSSGLMLISFKTTSYSHCSVLLSHTPKLLLTRWFSGMAASAAGMFWFVACGAGGALYWPIDTDVPPDPEA